MKRPLWIVGAVLLPSIAVSFMLESRKSLIFSIALTITALLFAVLRKERLKVFAVVALAVALGFAVTGYYKYAKLEPFDSYTEKTVQINGFVEESKKSSESALRYTIRAEFPNEPLPKSRIILRDYIGADLSTGDSFTAFVKLRVPKYETTAGWYLSEGIACESLLMDIPQLIETSPDNRFSEFFVRMRMRIHEKNVLSLPKESSAVVNGMVFGMTGDLEPQLYSDLNRSGTSHLLSVSGLHLAIVAGFAVLVLSKTRLRPEGQNIIAIIVVCTFSLLVGFSPAIVRSLIMTVVFLFGRIISRESDSLTSLGVSGIIIAYLKPNWVLAAGLWLSFLATAGILVVGVRITAFLKKHFNRENKYYNRLVAFFSAGFGVTAGAFIFTLPVMLLLNGWVSVVSPLANIFVAPFSSVVVIGGLLIAILPTWFPLFSLFCVMVDFSAKMIVSVSNFMSRLPFAVFSVDNIPLLAVFICVCTAIYLVILKKKLRRYIAVVLAGCLFVLSATDFATTILQRNYVQLAVINGGAHTVLVRENSAVVIGETDKYNVQSLISYLQYRRIDNIDCLITAKHSEQITSADLMIKENFTISSIIGPDDGYILEMLAETYHGTPVYACDYANVTVLDSAVVNFKQDGEIINLYVNTQKIAIVDEKYDIINANDTVYILRNGEIISPHYLKRSWQPLGEYIYGEQRIVIPL